MFFRTIGWRIFWSFSALLIMLGLVIGITSFEFAQKMVEDSAANQLRVQSISLSTQVQRHLRRMETNLKNLQSNPTLLSLLQSPTENRAVLENLLQKRISAISSVEDFFLFDRSGAGVSSTDHDWLPFDAAKESFFIQGQKTYHFGNIYNSPDEGIIQIVSLPLIGPSGLVGVLAAQVKLAAIYELMDQKLGVAENAEAFLLDTNLRFITPGKTGADDLQQSHLTATPLVQRLKNREEFWVGNYKSFRGSQVLGTVIKIPGYNWYLAIERDYGEVEGQVIGIIRGVVIATAVLLILLIGTTFIITRSITRPVQSLVESARRISAGNLDRPIEIPSRDDEITFLATEFDKMRAKVAASQVKLIERLEESEQRRIDSERLAAIGTLAATLAHEIRNPLNAMGLLLARLERKPSSIDPDMKILGSFRGEIQRLDRMISRILDYAKPINLDLKEVPICALIKEILQLYSEIFESRKIILTHNLDQQDLTIRADRDQLKQCLVNVLQNSIDAIEDSGAINIKITGGPKVAEVMVADTGPGFPDAERNRLFDLFYTTKEKGTGLGLSTVRKILDAHGATISLENDAQGQGGLVRIQLPI